MVKAGKGPERETEYITWMLRGDYLGRGVTLTRVGEGNVVGNKVKE